MKTVRNKINGCNVYKMERSIVLKHLFTACQTTLYNCPKYRVIEKDGRDLKPL